MQRAGTGLTRHSSSEQPKPKPLWLYAAIALVAVLLAVVAYVVISPSGNDEIVYCSGKDVSGAEYRSVRNFNNSSDSGGSTAALVDDFSSSETADSQRQEYLRRLNAGECDVVYLDVIYMTEFASKKLLRDMTSYFDRHSPDTFDDRLMQTVTYRGRYWGVPKQLDGGVIFYRGGPAPATWREILERSAAAGGTLPGLRVQLDGYEGLTVVFLELAYAAGAQDIVSKDRKTARLYQPGTLAALDFMNEAIQRRAVPPSVTRQGDAGSLYAFSTGRARFLRSWPYVESLFQPQAERAYAHGSTTASARFRIARHHNVIPLPPWTRGGSPVGILGGHDLVIPRSAKNPAGARRLIDFLTTREQVLRDAETASQAPVLRELWPVREVEDDPALSAVNDMVLRLRPLLPNYAEISRDIYTTLRRVLRTHPSAQTLDNALRHLDADVQAVLDRA
jgi:ABC-type glycerol-3-phosphate transport system substrate-binding protein